MIVETEAIFLAKSSVSDYNFAHRIVSTSCDKRSVTMMLKPSLYFLLSIFAFSGGLIAQEPVHVAQWEIENARDRKELQSLKAASPIDILNDTKLTKDQKLVELERLATEYADISGRLMAKLESRLHLTPKTLIESPAGKILKDMGRMMADSIDGRSSEMIVLQLKSLYRLERGHEARDVEIEVNFMPR